MIDIKSTQSRRVRTTFKSIYQRGLDWKLMLVGVAIVFYAQFVLIDKGEPVDGFIPSNGRSGLILGFLVATIAAYLFDTRLRYAPWTASIPRALRFDLDGPRTFILGVGVFAFVFLTLRLLGNSTSGSDIWIWVVALVGCAVPFAPSVRRVTLGLRRVWDATRLQDILIVGSLIAIFIGINGADLSDWYYSSIGDEFSFFELAAHFAQNGIDRPFSQAGVYDFHPRLGLMMKSLVMDLLGVDYFGWKFSSILIISLIVAGVYIAGTLIGGRVTGAIAATIIAFSHFLGQLAHVGYDHTDSLLPVILAMGSFFAAMRTKSPLLFFITGVLTGLCFYTNVAARVVLPTIVVFGILQHLFNYDRRVINWAAPFAIGLGLVVLPMLLVDGTEVWNRMLDRVIGGQGEITNLPLYGRILTNINYNLFAFNFNAHSSHYISGSLLDPVTATLAVVATGFGLGRFRDPTSLLLIIWLVLSFIGTGGLSPYDWHTATTRLFPMMLPLALLVGYFVANFIWPIDVRVLQGDNTDLFNKKAILVVGLLAVGLITLMANYQRAKIETPSVFHNSPVAVSIGAMQSDHCNYLPPEQIAVVSNGQHLIRRILNSYEPGSIELYPQGAAEHPDSPLMIDNRQALDRGFSDAERFGCIIFTHPWEDEQTQLISALHSEYPSGYVVPFSDHSGKTTVSIFKLP